MYCNIESLYVEPWNSDMMVNVYTYINFIMFTHYNKININILIY